jgi:hypothetical protein
MLGGQVNTDGILWEWWVTLPHLVTADALTRGGSQPNPCLGLPEKRMAKSTNSPAVCSR